MRTLRRVLTALLVTVATSVAQPPEGWSSVKSLSSGTQVRIALAESHTVTGKFQSVTDTSLTVSTGGGPKSIDRQQVRQLSARTQARRKRSTLIGLAVGAGGGAAIGGAAASSCSGSICGGHGAALVAGGTGGGALVGALIGAAVSHGGWREIYRQ